MSREDEIKELLEKTEDAIAQLLNDNVASYRIGERWFTKLSLNDLLEFRRQLLRELTKPITLIADPFNECGGQRQQ